MNALARDDILCFSSTDWHGKWGSRQQVMSCLAERGYRILYVEQMAGVEHLIKYADLRRRRRQRWREGICEIKPDLWIASPPPLFPGRYYWPAVARLNAALVRLWLRPYLRRLDIVNPILWLYMPEHAPLAGTFHEVLSVYHCIDEFTAGTHERKRRTIAALEGQLLRQVDLVFANSQLIYENKRQHNLRTYRIPSGADVAHFAQAATGAGEVPPEVGALPRPVLAYLGTIDERIDLALLASVANSRPQWSIALIGPVLPAAVDTRPLQEAPNVHWLGRRPFATLPSLLRGVDVCLLPYVQGEATRYRSPLKLYEYLATGKPIVSVEHPEAREFSDVIEIAAPGQFVGAIERALAGDTADQRKRRMEIAKLHSWEVRVDRMQEILAGHLE